MEEEEKRNKQFLEDLELLKEAGVEEFEAAIIAAKLNPVTVETMREWDTAYINALPDAAFAVIEPAYKQGKVKDKRARHLPHHTKNVRNGNENTTVDLAHYRNALARVDQIKPITDSISQQELVRRARAHLEKHRDVLKTEKGE